MAKFLRPGSLSEALTLMKGQGIMPYAGGTDVMVHLREHGGCLEGVEAFLDVSALPELRGIEKRGEELRIGAGVTHTEIAESPLLRQYAPALCEASASVGSTQIRNAGTIGGNVCNGSLAADTLSVLTALSARLELCSADGSRVVDITAVHLGKGRVDIHSDELLTAIYLPVLQGYRFAYIKLGRRKALAISRMNVAAALKLEEGRIMEARIAPGCVFSKPERAVAAEELLRGKEPSEELFEQAGKAVSAQMIERTGVRWSTEYKQPVIETLTARALRKAVE